MSNTEKAPAARVQAKPFSKGNPAERAVIWFDQSDELAIVTRYEDGSYRFRIRNRAGKMALAEAYLSSAKAEDDLIIKLIPND